MDIDRNEHLDACLARLLSRPEEYIREVFGMSKAELSTEATDYLKNQRAKHGQFEWLSSQQLPGKIWARTLWLLTHLANLMASLTREGKGLAHDERVLSYIDAVNLISLNYGILYVLRRSRNDESWKLGYFRIKDDGLKCDWIFHTGPDCWERRS